MNRPLPLLCFSFFFSCYALSVSVTATRCQSLGEVLPYTKVGKTFVRSLLNLHPRLVAIAEETGRNAIHQKALNTMLEVELTGDFQGVDGKNRASLGSGYYEIKNASGARLIVKRELLADGSYLVSIVGKCSKQNQDQLFNYLRKTFFDFPAPPSGMSRRRN